MTVLTFYKGPTVRTLQPSHLSRSFLSVHFTQYSPSSTSEVVSSFMGWMTIIKTTTLSNLHTMQVLESCQKPTVFALQLASLTSYQMLLLVWFVNSKLTNTDKNIMSLTVPQTVVRISSKMVLQKPWVLQNLLNFMALAVSFFTSYACLAVSIFHKAFS